MAPVRQRGDGSLADPPRPAPSAATEIVASTDRWAAALVAKTVQHQVVGAVFRA